MSAHTDAGEATTLGRKTPAADLPRAAVAYRWAVGLTAISLLALLVATRPPLSTSNLWQFLLAAVVADTLFRIRVRAGAYYSFAPTFTIVYFLVAGGVAAALLEALVRIIGWVVTQFRRQTAATALYGLFITGVHVFAALGAAGLVALILAQPVMFMPVLDLESRRAILIFALGYLAVELFLSSIAVAARMGWQEVANIGWRQAMLWITISAASSVAFAFILWQLIQEMGFEAAILFVFLLVAAIATMLRLNVGLRSGNEELQAINRIGQLLSSTLDPTQIFRILARETRSVLPWDGFFIATVQPGSDTIQLIFMTAEGSEIAQRTMARGSGLTGRAMESGEAIHFERREGEDKTVSVEDTIRGRQRPRSILVAPMMFGSESLGAISVQSFQYDVYGKQQVQLLKTIASQAAIAIRNAELLRREQQAITERDEFLSLTTHEIKNPLTSVRGYLELAEDSIRHGKADEAIESLRVVRTEAKKIQRFAEDLLEVSRIGGGKFTIQPQETDLAEITSRVVQRYADTSEQHVLLTLEQRLPKVFCDPVRIGQVVENLVSNAVKYSPPSGRIEVSLASQGDRVVLTVRDEGIGIPEPKIPLIFERFYRVEE
ncbi:MAG TPA: ATP-binding protein, partial [Thermoanaerobaculia bacterium]